MPCRTTKPLRIAVGIATAGRPKIIAAALEELSEQSRVADAMIVCAPSEADVRDVKKSSANTEIILGVNGLTKQRNAILRRSLDCDVVVFFDDDFFPERTYLERMERLFLQHGEVVLATGHVILDGILGPGLDIERAREALKTDAMIDTSESEYHDVYNGYGCNMAIRLAAIRRTAMTFDEDLPLYGWLEDVDFSRRLRREGRVVKLSAARGVHLGIKAGRQSGLRLGYSQVANPLYLAQNGTVAWSRALYLIARNIGANCVRVLRPEPYVDRVGRLGGNAMGLSDLFRRRLHPTRILEL